MIQTYWNRDSANAHDLFQSWRLANPDGLFINCKSSRSGMLHRVECPHLGSTDWKASKEAGSLTENLKVCSISQFELRDWAQTNHLLTLSICQDCQPIEDRELITITADKVETLGDFDSKDVADARMKVIASIVRRQGQPAFRQQLLEIYEGKCAFTGCGIAELLDAAHIKPYKGPQTNHPQNGLLLRTDLHTLFDLGLVAIDSSKMTILIANSLARSAYGPLNGKRIFLPTRKTCCPSREALDHHRIKSGLAR